MSTFNVLDYYKDHPITFIDLEPNVSYLSPSLDGPEIIINKNTQTLSISGSCYLEKSANLFYQLNEILKSIDFKHLDFQIDIIYINSTSTKQLIDLLEDCIQNIQSLRLSWRCDEEDEDMEDLIKITAKNLNKHIEIIYHE